MWSYHKETRRFSLGGVGLGIFICSTSFSPGDQKNFSWWGGADDQNWIPPPYQEKISLSPGPLMLMFYFVFNVVAVLIENLWKVYLKYFWTELSPRDQKIFSWWGEAGNIYLLFYAIDDSIVNLWDHYLKYFNFIDRFGGFTRRPGDFLLVGWGWEYLFFWIDFQLEIRIVSWCFGWKSMKT